MFSASMRPEKFVVKMCINWDNVQSLNYSRSFGGVALFLVGNVFFWQYLYTFRPGKVRALKIVLSFVDQGRGLRVGQTFR